MPVDRAVLVGQFEFIEWTPDVALREDKRAREVGREND
jgi:hypothetical protein